MPAILWKSFYQKENENRGKNSCTAEKQAAMGTVIDSHFLALTAIVTVSLLLSCSSWRRRPNSRLSIYSFGCWFFSGIGRWVISSCSSLSQLFSSSIKSLISLVPFFCSFSFLFTIFQIHDHFFFFKNELGKIHSSGTFRATRSENDAETCFLKEILRPF